MTDAATYRRRQNWTVGAIAACALMALAGSIATIVCGHAPAVSPFDVGSVAIVVTVAARILIPLRVGRHRITQSLTITALMLGVMTLAWPWLVLAVAIGVPLARFHARMGPRRVLFYASRDVIVVTVAMYVGAALGIRPGFTASDGTILPLLAIALVMLATDEALTMTVRALANLQSVRATFARNWHLRIASSLIGLLIAIGARYVFGFDQRIAIATPLVIAGLQLAYANHAHQHADRLAWQRLARLADLFGAADSDGVYRAAVTGAAELFSSDEVELELIGRNGSSRLIRGDATGITYDGPASVAPERRGMLVRAALENADSGRDNAGELRIRFATAVTFTEREHYTLRAVAAALGTAIRKAGAVTAASRIAVDQAHAATHDDLTGLANRRHLLDTGAALANQGTVGLVVLDINRFKQVNDALGRSVGDEVLLQISERLAAALATGPGDMAARLGGAEFGALFAQVSSPSDALSRTRDLIAALGEPIEIDAVHLEMRATAGIAV
ncbi:MAG TPA: GGDEF domain-containing protein, partial [Micromonosporaceae bacterium]